MMATQYRTFVPRSPRHATADVFAVELRRIGESARSALRAPLIDFSRQGLRVQSDGDFDLGERLVVRIAADDFAWEHEATVRWRNELQVGHAAYGCMFDAPIEWEVLGELLLRGILAAD